MSEGLWPRRGCPTLGVAGDLQGFAGGRAPRGQLAWRGTARQPERRGLRVPSCPCPGQGWVVGWPGLAEAARGRQSNSDGAARPLLLGSASPTRPAWGLSGAAERLPAPVLSVLWASPTPASGLQCSAEGQQGRGWGGSGRQHKHSLSASRAFFQTALHSPSPGPAWGCPRRAGRAAAPPGLHRRALEPRQPAREAHPGSGSPRIPAPPPRPLSRGR